MCNNTLDGTEQFHSIAVDDHPRMLRVVLESALKAAPAACLRFVAPRASPLASLCGPCSWPAVPWAPAAAHIRMLVGNGSPIPKPKGPPRAPLRAAAQPKNDKIPFDIFALVGLDGKLLSTCGREEWHLNLNSALRA